jgi:cell wall-associated protease
MKISTKYVLTFMISLLMLMICTSAAMAVENEQHLGFGEKVSGEINAENTSDRYVINLEESGLLEIDFSSYIDYGVNVTLEDENGTEVIDVNVQGGKPADPKKWLGSEYLEPGAYYLKINKYITYTGKYELEVNMEETNNTEKEPNDGTGQALEAELNKKVTGLISWNDSGDAFKVTLKEAGLLNIDFSSYIGNNENSTLKGVNLSLENENGEEVIDEVVGGGELADPTKWSGSQYLEPGTYYLKVSKYYGSTGKYDLELNVEETNNTEIEPNNGTGQAFEAEFNKKITGLISWNDSVDAFKVTMEKAGLLKIDFSSYINNNAYSSLTGVYLSLEDEKGTKVIEEKISGGELADPTKWNDSQYLEPGTYYLKISKYYGSTGKYDLELNLEETNNTEIEPNNGTEQAHPLLLNESVIGLISWNDVLDTYEFTMEDSGDIELNFSSYIDYAVSLTLVDENGEVLFGESIRNGTATSPKKNSEIINLQAGKYYLHVNRENGMTGKYELAINIKSGWVQENGDWYFYTSEGKQTGWLKDGASWYYLDSDGVMKTGWIKDGGKWYLLQSSGAMVTGWTKSGGQWYHMDAGGVMQTGWMKDGGKWYLLQPSGAMATGWAKSGSSWYYMNAGGVMQTGWLKQGTQWYYLKSSGIMATGWVSVGGEWYYMYSSGTMASNTTIDGYKLGPSGALY